MKNRNKKEMHHIRRAGRAANIAVLALLVLTLVVSVFTMNIVIAAASEYPNVIYVQTTGGDNRG